MPTELDIKLIPKVLEIIQRFGFSVTLITPAQSYSVATGATTTTTTSQTAYITPPEPYERKYVDGTSILAADLRTYMAASGLSGEPKPNAKITISGRSYTIIPPVKPIMTGEQIALYELQLR
jgi:hypothetical protein